MQAIRVIILLCIFLCAVAASHAQGKPLASAPAAGLPPIKTVFIILLENHNWSQIDPASAPYIHNTLLPLGAHAEQYFNPPGLHPSEPNYLWLEAGDNLGVTNDADPATNHQSTVNHLATLLTTAGLSWKAYQEDISGTTCPLTRVGLYVPRHNPFIFFDDVTNTNDPNSANCIAHVRPYSELATDLQNNTVASYNFITPNLCNDMHDCSVSTGDTWLSREVPRILASQAYKNGGVILITWDEGEGSDGPIGMIALSPFAKTNYSNTIHYTHSSTLRTVQGFFGVTPLLRGAANATDLSDFFTGGASAPAVTLSPTSLNFGNQLVGSASSPSTITLTDSGNAALSISSIIITGTNAGDFALSPTGGTPCSFGASSLGAGSSCTFSVTFTPGAAGARAGRVTVASNAASSPDNDALSGTGTAPAVGLSPSPVAFGNQPVGSASGPRTITLTNSGSATLNIGSIAVTGTNAGDFALSPAGSAPCSFGASSLGAGNSCTFNIMFTPASAGSRAGNVSVASGASSSPDNVPLSGTGVASAPAVNLSPSPTAFGNQPVGSASSPRTITLTNSGNATLNIGNIAVIGSNSTDFALSAAGATPCSFGASSLGAGKSCTFNVTFTPGAAGARAASITVTTNASTSPDNDVLSGTGTTTGVALSPSPVAFGNQTVGSASSPHTITLTNSGSATLNIASIAVTGANAAEFALLPAGGAPCSFGASSLVAGNSCTISITFTPRAAGVRTGNVTVTSNATSSPDNDALSGTGAAPAGVSLSVNSLAFGTQPVGSTSSPLSVTLTSSGGTQLNISSLALGGTNAGDFAKSDTCGASVASGGSCTIQAAFTPTAAGARSAVITITDDAAGSPRTVTLSGTGASSILKFSTTSVSFGSQNVGTNSAVSSITLTNSGNGPLTISSISIAGSSSADFSATSACPVVPATLAASASCSVAVIFKPIATGARNAAVKVVDDAQGSPHSFSVSGVGVDFAPVPSGPASATLTPGQSAVFNINLGTQGGPLAAAVTFACSNLPASVSCSFNPASIPAGSTTGSTTLTISTTAPRAALGQLNPPERLPQGPFAPGGFPSASYLLLFALIALGARRFGRRSAVDLRGAGALVALVLVFAIFQTGCAGITGGATGPAVGGTPPGTSTIVVTATSGGVSHSITITLTVNTGIPVGGGTVGTGGTGGTPPNEKGRPVNR
jgi:hypothetical protein